jgi:hypothetical protein
MAENENAISPAPAEGGQPGGEATAAATEAPQAEATPAEATPAETTSAEAPQAETPPAETPQAEATPEAPPQPEAPPEEITYHAVEKDGQVTAIWEMQGRKHLRTIDPRSRQGQEILRLYTAEHHEEQ